jgi:hypothetical protein
MGVADHEKHHGSTDRYAQETHEHKSVPPHDSLRSGISVDDRIKRALISIKGGLDA